MLTDALAVSTKRSYARVWHLLRSFCAEISRPEKCQPPVSPSIVFLFLTQQVSRGVAGRSLLSYCSAISFVHKLRNLPDPTNSLAIRKLLIAAKKHNPSGDLRLPITSDILSKLLQVLPGLITSHYELKLLSALYLVCFHGCFRIGELLPKSQCQKGLVIQFKDLQMHSSVMASKHHYMNLILHHSKNLQPGTSTRVSISSKITVDAMREFLKLRGRESGPLFSFPGGLPFLRSRFDFTLKLAVRACNLQGRYLGHSFRLGAATEAAARGWSDSQIRQLGRWRSNAFLNFIRQSN